MTEQQAPVLRNFCTGVSFTVEETLRKTSKDGELCGRFVPRTVGHFPEFNHCDLSYIKFSGNKHHKVVFDALHHFERDINKNMLNHFDMEQIGSWAATETVAPEDDKLLWIPPPPAENCSHTVFLPIGPDPILAFPVGHLSQPVIVPVHGAIMIHNESTKLLVSATKTSVILSRGASRSSDVKLG